MNKSLLAGVGIGVVVAGALAAIINSQSAKPQAVPPAALLAAEAVRSEAGNLVAADASAQHLTTDMAAKNPEVAAIDEPKVSAKATVVAAPPSTSRNSFGENSAARPAEMVRTRYAEVLASTPVTKTEKVAREECHDESVTKKKPVKDEHQIAGSLIGAVVGGVLGNQVGGGDGKKIATAAGAIAGGYAGNQVQRRIQNGATETVMEKKCVTVYDSHQKPSGFDVKYRVDGKILTVRMDHSPNVGSHLPVENGRVMTAANSH